MDTPEEYNTRRNGNVPVWIAISLNGITLAGAIIVFFWTIANPREDIKQVRYDFQQEIGRVAKELEAGISRNETAVEQRWTLREHQRYSDEVERQLARLATELDRVKSDQVSRSEHQEHWREIDNQIGDVRTGLMNLRNDYSKTYSAGDQLKSLQDQIEKLRERIAMKTAVPPK